MAKTKRTIGVNLEAADLEVLRQVAVRERRSISFLIRDIVHEFLQRQESPKAASTDAASLLLHEIPGAVGLDTGTERGDARLARELLTAAAHLDRLAEQSGELESAQAENVRGEESAKT
jgi:hypothetical protein